METLPYNDVEKLLPYLRATFAGDNIEVKAATDMFKQMSANFLQFTDSMMMVILDERCDEEFIKIKNSACLIFTSFLSQVNRPDHFSLENKAYIANAIITAMCSNYVALPLKITLNLVLRTMYNADTSAYLRNQGLIFVKNNLGSGKPNEITTSLLVFEGLIKTPSTSREAIAEWFVSLRNPIMKCGDDILNGIVAELGNLHREDLNQKDMLENISNALKTLKIWVSLILDCLKILRKPDEKTRLVTQYIQVIVDEEFIVKTFANILRIQALTQKQIANCVISTSGLKEIDQPLNAVKAVVITTFNKFLECLSESKSLLDFTKTKFFAFIKNDGIKGILESVFLFCKNDQINLEEAVKDKCLNECLVECLIFLTHLTMLSAFNDIYAEYKKNLILDICLPLMCSTKHELEQFQHNHSQFVYLASDCCNKQESQTPKTQATQLLEYICDNTDGALTYLVMLAINVIEYSLVSNDPTQITPGHIVLDPNSKIIAQTDSRIRVETCLLALCPVHHLISSRDDLVLLLEQLFAVYQEFFLGDKSDGKYFDPNFTEYAIAVIKARVCLFLGFYLDIIFQQESNEEMFKIYLKFLVQCIGYHQPEVGALSYQAIDTLAFIFTDKDITNKMTEHMESLLETLLIYSKDLNSLKLFEILERILKEYDYRLQKNPKLFAAFLSVMVERVQVEYEKVRLTKNASRAILTKIWNIFRLVAENRHFIPEFQEDIEKILIPLFSYLNSNEKVSFQDDIVKYMISVTKASKRVSPACWEIFKAFPKIFLQTQKISTLLFVALNNVIFYGNRVLENDPGAVKTLVDMGIHALTYCQTKSEEVSISNGALLLHLVIHYFSNITDEDWNRILGVCIDMLFQSKKDFVKARLGGVILCTFMRKFELTQAILINKNALGAVMDLFLKETLMFELHQYDRKLLVIGLSSFLAQSKLDPSVYQRLPDVLDVLVSLLKYIQYMEEKEREAENEEEEDGPKESLKTSDPTILEKFLNNIYIDSRHDMGKKPEEQKLEAEHEENGEEDSSDEGDNFFLDKADEAEANLIVNKMKTDLKDKDEFAIFKECLAILKSNNEAVASELFDRIPIHKKDFLRDILQSQRIVVDEKGEKTETRRIVKPKTRKIATNVTHPMESAD